MDVAQDWLPAALDTEPPIPRIEKLTFSAKLAERWVTGEQLTYLVQQANGRFGRIWAQIQYGISQKIESTYSRSLTKIPWCEKPSPAAHQK